MSSIGKWLVWLVGLVMIAGGAKAVWQGLDIVQVERGWSAVIAGTTALSAGVLMMGIGALIDRVDALRRSLADLPGLAAGRRPERKRQAETTEEPSPPVPVEIPVEPLPSTPPPPAPWFGRRPGQESSNASSALSMERQELAPPPLDPGDVGAPEPAVPEIAAPLPPRIGPISMQRPLWARTFGDREKDNQAEEPAPVATAEPAEPEPPSPELPVSGRPVAPPPIEPAHEQEFGSVSEPATAAAEIEPQIAEVVRLPRVPPFGPLTMEAPTAGEGPPETPAERHEWLEKALAGDDEGDPALDWLRARREPSASAEPPKRRLPGFMRRREVTGDSEAEIPSEDISPAPPAAAPSVVGRYSAHGSNYTLYSDGAIDAETPEGPLHFASMAELRAHLEARNLVAEQ